MKASIDNLGAVGLVSDVDSYDTPPNAWDTLDNIRCDGHRIMSFPGYANLDDLTRRPEAIEYVKAGVNPLLAYAAGNKIYSWFDGIETDISLRSYIGSGWQSTVLGGVAIFNNGSENPQYWGGSGTCVDLPFDDTCTWTEAELTAKVIRTFKNFGFALAVSVCGTYNPRRIIWSHPAETGTVPSSWDITDDTTLAGDAFLSDTSGDILDGLALRDAFIIYKEDAIYSVTYTGDARGAGYIFNVRLITSEHGLYSRDCVCDIGGAHVFIGDGDIYIFDGNRPRSIAEDRVRDLFFENVNRTYYTNVFVTFHDRESEVWICYPSGTSQYCDTALIWHTTKNVWYQRDLPDVSTAIYAILPARSNLTWDTLTAATWQDLQEDMSTTWDSQIIPSPITDSLIVGGDAELIRMDIGETADGVDFTCTAQKTHLDAGDAGDWHMITQIRPRATGDAFRVRVGYHDVINDPVTWSDYQTFTPGTDYKLDFRVTGRLHAIEFSQTTAATWEVHSYEIEYQPAGRR